MTSAVRYGVLCPVSLLMLFACGSSTESTDIRSVAYLLDESGELSFEAARAGEFTPVDTTAPTFGYSGAVAWLRVELAPASVEQRLLSVEYAHLDHIEFFAPVDGGWRRSIQGDAFPFGERAIASPRYFFALPGALDASGGTVYLRVQSSGPLIVPLVLVDAKRAPQNEAERIFLLGALTGLLLIIGFFNLSLFFTTGDPAFGLYSGYVLAIAFVAFTLEKLEFMFLWPESPGFSSKSFLLVACTSFTFAPLFAAVYLNTKETSRALDRTLKVFAGISFCVGIYALLGDYRTSVRLTNPLVALTSLLIIASGAIAFLRGYRPARFFLIAWPLMLIGIVLLTLRFFGVVPDNFLTRNGAYLGVVLEVILLSLGLGDRMNQMRKDKEQAQRESLERQRELTQSYARFVPEELLRQLGKQSILELQPGDAVETELTILFSDIRSFTRISESMTPEENFAFLNGFLRNIGPVIRKRGGYIDKYIGDAIMALFPRAPADALDAALKMRRLLAAYNARRRERGEDVIQIGVGIHTGRVMLGAIGEAKRLEGTVISDAVNLASRLESLCKRYETTILTSEQTLFQTGDPEQYEYRILEYVRVKGKSEVVTVVELFEGDPPDLFAHKRATRPEFDRALREYLDGDFSGAGRRFAAIAAAHTDDRAARSYEQRCEDFSRRGAPAGWEGVTRLEEK